MIDVFLEFYRDEIIGKLRKFLAPLSPKDLKQCVNDGKSPPVPAEAIKELKGYEDYLEKLRPEEVFQWVVSARPDLAEVLVELGDAGAEYVIKLQAFIVDSIRSPEGTPKQTPESQVSLHCEACGADWTLPKSQAEQIQMCPFCGVGKEEETKVENEEE